MAYNILIVDDNSVIRHSLRCTLEQEPEWRICGEAENGQVAVQKVQELRPDVVILDLQMPVMNGLDAARQIALLAPETAMVMFTMHATEELWEEARAAGIRDIVSKSEAVTESLMLSVRRVCHEKPESMSG